MSDFPYQPFYCEENVWHLCQSAPFDGGEVYVVVISNEQGACPLWNQRACQSPSRPIFWDYHVVAVETGGDEDRVWDLDSRLGCPAAFDIWWQGTFPSLEGFPAEFRPRFRVIDAEDYLRGFSSDRSHMEDGEGGYKKPPPSWEPIQQADVAMNLDRLLDTDDEFLGTWMSDEQFALRVGGQNGT